MLLSLFLACLPTLSQSPSSSTKSTKPEEKPADTVARAVHHQILILPFYSVFDSINFSISGDTVTLTGQVIRPTLRSHAEASVKTIEGVRIVVNNIEVLPQSSPDDELRRDVYRAIFENTELAQYAVHTVPPIHILVKNGTVTLVGAVDKEADIPLATKEASKVPNVTSLQNLLTLRKSDSSRK